MTARATNNMMWAIAGTCAAVLIALVAYCAIQAAVLVMGAV